MAPIIDSLLRWEAFGGMFCSVSWRACLSLSGSDLDTYMHTYMAAPYSDPTICMSMLACHALSSVGL